MTAHAAAGAAPHVASPTRLAARLRRLAAWLPKGDSLPEASWQARHRQIRLVIWAHAAGFSGYAAYALLTGRDSGHLLGETSALALLAIAAGWRGFGKRAAAAVATIGLFSASALLTHLTGGLIEAHFHFFVMVVVVSLYQAWLPFLLGLVFVVVHHGLLGTLLATRVFDHPAAVADPWKWAAIHAAFILAQSVACLVAWRVNEDALERERGGRTLLEKANEELEAAQELSLIGSWEADFRTGTVIWSRQMYRMLGVDPATEPGYELLLAHVHPDDKDRLVAEIQRTLTDHVPVDVEHRMRSADGQEFVVHARGRCVVDGGQIVQMLGTCQDVTEQRRLEREIEYRAYHDTLTGLGNRAMFIDRMTHALAVRHRSGAPLTALYLDLDDFKTVNDSLGHASGDELLTAVAARLRTSVRPGDTVARLGGDEFAILLEDTDVEGAKRTAARILEALSLPVPLRERSLAVRASIGIAEAAPPYDAEEVLRDADLAMYVVKSEGKASYRVFTPEMLTSVVNRMDLMAELRDAVEAEQFIVHYQPIVDLASGRVRGVEALVRWDHPERGIIPPLDFIPLAEETGLILPLGEWVMRTATQEAKRLQEALGERITVSVNVSARQFSEDVAAMVAAAVADAGLAPEDLIVELTESCLINQDEAVLAQLTELRRCGVRVAIDDFGTGYSSLGYLRDLPVDMLKIDRRFVQDIEGVGEQQALTQAIITLSDTFHLETVAEGIETIGQADTLVAYGCQSGQGFFYSKPKAAGPLLEELRRHAADPAMARAV